MRDYAPKEWLKPSRRTVDADRLVFWALVAGYSIAKAWGVV